MKIGSAGSNEVDAPVVPAERPDRTALVAQADRTVRDARVARTSPIDRFVRRALIAVFASSSFSAAAFAADTAGGAALYRVHCQSCHGARGAGEFPGTMAFARANGLMRTDTEIVRALERGSPGMPGYFGIMTELQLYDLVAYLRTLQ